MSINKKKYELSIWTEKLDIYGKKEEHKSYIIGADDMLYLGRAYSLVLKRNIKGTNNLTFSMTNKFFNSETGKYEKNEFIEFLKNETKLKLKYDEEFFEFYIKKITEKKENINIIYSFECEDSYIDELSRTGYDITFDTELLNSVDEIGAFTKETLDDSLWFYNPKYNYGDFTEYRYERFYKIPTDLFSDLKASLLNLKVKDDFKFPQITNLKDGKSRPVEYSDDLARENKLFFDPHPNDNGDTLYKPEIIISNDSYIYVPTTDLSYIYGNFISDSFKNFNKPAIYGTYDNNDNKLALLPRSNNPMDYIQFLYFNGEKIKINENGYITNTNCHYLITIQDWNNSLKTKLLEQKELIHWFVDTNDFSEDEIPIFNDTYKYKNENNIYYTIDVNVNTSFIDDFKYYPVYSDGFLDNINDTEIYGAKKISIADRTEYNKNLDAYVTVYKNKATEFGNMYYLNGDDFATNIDDYRICSTTETRVILPTLSENLVLNGKNFLDTTGWLSKTQNSLNEYNTGSYENLLSISVKQLSNSSNEDGSASDESISSTYLEIQSPNVAKNGNFNLINNTNSDMAINFGLVGKEKKIEKNKVYGIRMITLDFENDTIKYNLNTDINKVIIGQGSIDINGNYTISENNSVSFSELDPKSDPESVPELTVLPTNTTLKINLTTYYNYNNNNWVASLDSQDNSIADLPFILFKSDKDIENPYIGINMKSGKLELDTEKTYKKITWMQTFKLGVYIDARAKDSNGEYKIVDGLKISIDPINTTYYNNPYGTNSFLNYIKRYKDNDGGYLESAFDGLPQSKKSKTYYWTNYSNSKESRLFSDAVILEKVDNLYMSAPYAIYINDTLFGIFWFTGTQIDYSATRVGYINDFSLYKLNFKYFKHEFINHISTNINPYEINTDGKTLKFILNENLLNDLRGKRSRTISISDKYYIRNSILKEEDLEFNKLLEEIEKLYRGNINLNFIISPLDNISWHSILYRYIIKYKKDGAADIEYNSENDKCKLNTYNPSSLNIYFYIYNKQSNKYIYNKNLTLSDFVNEVSRVSTYAAYISYSSDFNLKQDKTILNLYSLELFEAYTRGADIVDDNTTILRPEETLYLNSDYRNSNYFNYKYSGRDIDLKEKFALISSKDLLQETDVTLGNTYSFNKYFIEAIKYKSNKGVIYKDSFMIKDYVNEIGNTLYTEDDIEVVTNPIDLSLCQYYKSSNKIENNKYDCSYNNNNKIFDKECLYQKYGFCPYLFTTEKHPRKVRTLNIEKSNRFNIIQQIGKVFEIYPLFYTEYQSTGKVKTSEGKTNKYVYFITEDSKENPYGFRYLKNLSSITRTVDSNQITTKLFVQNVDSSLSDNGMCSIQNAEDNLGKNSYILDFSYYILKNMINKEENYRDLYGIDKNDFAFLPTIDYYNTKYDSLAELIINLNKTYTELEAKKITKVEGITGALEEKLRVAKSMYLFKIRNVENNKIDYTISDTYSNYLSKYKQYASIIWNNIEELFITNDSYMFKKDKEEELVLENFSNKNVALLKKYCKGELFWRFMIEGFDEDDIILDNELSTYKPPFSSWEEFKTEILDKNIYTKCGLVGQIYGLSNQIKEWIKVLNKYLNSIKDLVNKFNNKYEPYIKEGTWTDSNYLTDNEYYWAAKNILTDSCKPKLTYDIKVSDISEALDDYSDYNFNLGEYTFIEDEEFFGINLKTGLPNRLQVLITEFEYHLDNPTENKILVQNYSSSFDDLFGAISATVQTLSFNENVYNRSVNFTEFLTIKKDVIQGTLDGGNLTIVNSNNQNVVIDDSGSRGSNIDNSASKYKLNGLGLFFSTDGGQTWTLSCGPLGNNANHITKGQIDSSKILIVDGNYVYFLWDKSGISAYRNPANSNKGLIDFSRFNKYGLSLVENNKIRLRAGYEYLSLDPYNITGSISHEKELADQNIGFYLYNDSGMPIFKTETRSAYSSDTTTDYSARLSMTGEMFITNQVLDSESDGSTIIEKYIYDCENKYEIAEFNIPTLTMLGPADSTRIYAALYDNLTNLYLNSDQGMYCIFVHNNRCYFYFENGNDSTLVYSILILQNPNPSKYYVYDNEISKNSLNNYSYNEYSLELLIAATEDNRDEIRDEIRKAIENSTFSNYFETPIFEYTVGNIHNFYRPISYKTYNICYSKITSGDSAKSKSAGVSLDAVNITCYDLSNNINSAIQMQTLSLYKDKGNVYWQFIKRTTETEILNETGVSTQTVGVFINNKRLRLEDSNFLSLATGLLNSIIDRGSERIFTICLSGKENDEIVIKNIFSVLKNGCAYYGGTIKSYKKTNLELKSLDYLPDEISIDNPSMVITNDGNVIADWGKFFKFIKDANGNITGISSLSLENLI